MKNSVAAECHSAGAVPSDSPAGRVRLPPLKALVAFESAARHGSFVQAANELCVTPSAVSHQIQSLESFLGLALFTRRGGRVMLTKAGQRYFRGIDSAFRAIGEATAALGARSSGEMLTIVVSPSLAVQWLQPRLSAFLAACPDTRIRLSTLSNDAALRSGTFDIAIAYGRLDRPDVATLPLFTEWVRPLCSPALVRMLDMRSAADLHRATLIHSANLVDWAQYFSALGLSGLAKTSELWIDRSAMAIAAAADGLGVVLESDVLTEVERADSRLIAPFDTPASEIPVVGHHLAITRTALCSRRARLFLDWLESTVPQRNRAWSGRLTAAATAAGNIAPRARGNGAGGQAYDNAAAAP